MLREWYFQTPSGSSVGPLTHEDLQQAIAAGTVLKDTPVRRDQEPWSEANSWPSLAKHFPETAKTVEPSPSEAAPSTSGLPPTRWHYHTSNGPVGPRTLWEMREEIDRGVVNRATPVCIEGQAWRRADEWGMLGIPALPFLNFGREQPHPVVCFLRWLAVVPAGVLAALVASACVGWGYSRYSDEPTNFDILFLTVIRHIFLGAVFVIAGAYVAPKYQRWTATALAVVGVLLGGFFLNL